MAKNKWMKKLQELEGAVVDSVNPFLSVAQSPSPSLNFTFGKTWGLPQGFTLVLYGPPKGGKTVVCSAITGQVHKDDPDAMVVKFDTEFRESGQVTEEQALMWGIDRDRYLAYSVNSPVLVFDRIEKDIAAMCQDGAPIKLVIIDSITGIQGRRSEHADTIATQNIGDHALTIQEGLKRILPVQRKYRFALILTCHIRAEMDRIELMRHNTTKMAASFGVKHYAEYFMHVEQNRTSDARKDLLGNEFKDENLRDVRDGEGEKMAHKIRVKMMDSSLGPKGRVGEFTLDYNKGIVNVYEEVFLLGVARGVIERPNQKSYSFGNRQWNGKPAILTALKDESELRAEILKELKRRDLDGYYKAFDAANAANVPPEESP